MRKTFPVIALIAIIALSMMACNLPFFTQSAQTDIDQLSTAVAQTVQAQLTQVQPTLASLPTLTAQPTLAPLPTLVLPPTATPIPCNKAAFISETIPDGTIMTAGQTFTKQWTLKNIGTCTWDTSYKLVFTSGNALGGPASQALTSAISPNGVVSISLALTAPVSVGTYTGYWQMQGNDGRNFAQVFVQVMVGVPAPSFAVTSVIMGVDTNNFIGACPHTFHFTAAITTSAAGTVTYYWTRDDSASSAPASLVFSAAGTQTVTYDWSLGAPGASWVEIYIDNPNHQTFSPQNVNVTCS